MPKLQKNNEYKNANQLLTNFPKFLKLLESYFFVNKGFADNFSSKNMKTTENKNM